MARKRIKKILPKTTIGETIESFGPGGGVGGRTRVTKASGPKLEKEFMSNVKSGKTPAPSKGLVKVETSKKGFKDQTLTYKQKKSLGQLQNEASGFSNKSFQEGWTAKPWKNIGKIKNPKTGRKESEYSVQKQANELSSKVYKETKYHKKRPKSFKKLNQSKGLVKVETSPTKSPNRTKPLGYKSNPNDGIPF